MSHILFPDVEVELIGHDGNAFEIMGTVSKALKAAGHGQAACVAYRNEAMSGDYDNLLAVTERTVCVI